MTTRRPLNHCADCGDTWHPRGRDLSHRCPYCGSRNTSIVVLSSGNGNGCAGLIAAVIGLPLLLVGLSMCGFDDGSNMSEPTPEQVEKLCENHRLEPDWGWLPDDWPECP